MVREEDFTQSSTAGELATKDGKSFIIPASELEDARRAQWKAAIEAELQETVQQAAAIRQKITTAKTNYKKQFYGKKFTKVQGKVMQMLSALQRFQQKKTTLQAPHVHDEHCGHNHEPSFTDAPLKFEGYEELPTVTSLESEEELNNETDVPAEQQT